MLSTSDTIALSFGFASTFVAIVTIFVTRRAYLIPTTTDLERRPHASNVSDMQAQEVMRMEEVRLRRWATVKKNTFEK
ncbi:hypothetical protein L207DRAFT_511961 [Hyaloscypha variabilis F]|uniref:Uncharacterized protein n=1 Tax=Hyaloscypha variabilis (strain UAMH 11265 / GT02V1 / F) TaxID=1149755 RepID=A0A2J6RPQ0_HYAVF|nr:hypothetical protein L207DRAFT_511961 [Hyaloscypha variabilis F]